jgi:hypothetical protein
MAVALGALCGLTACTASATTLRVDGLHFTIDGKPVFLLGCSYYAGLGATPSVRDRDLDRLRRLKFNWLRVWATWNAFGVAADGGPREPYLSRLRDLVEACDRRGMIVDVTLSRGREQLADAASLRRAVETVIGALRSRRNWYLDIANERNVRDSRYAAMSELAGHRAAARKPAPWLLVTASQGGDLGEDDVRRFVHEVGVDFVAPHRPRHAGSPRETAAMTRHALAVMGQMGRSVPVHYQEPFRRGYGDWQPEAQDYLDDLRGAVAGGAAGWCLHNGSTRSAPNEEPRRSFDLRARSLFDQLDEEELAAMSRCAAIAREWAPAKPAQ